MSLRVLILGLVLAACEPSVVPGEFCADEHGNAVPRWTGYQCCETGGQCPENQYCYEPDECRGPLPDNDVPMMTRIGNVRRRFR